MRILIVDDDTVARRVLEQTLINNGYRVVNAVDGQQAWEYLHEDFIPLLIVDWMMPNMDGISLIRRIRAANFPRYVYIVLLTSLCSQDHIVAGLEAGADDYIIKPFHEGELVARLGIARRILELESSLRETRDALHYQATHDSLTGLLNRTAIIERANLELERSMRSGEPLSLALLDIDFFKQVNDTYGHLIGNEVLTMVGQLINCIVRPYDGVGRWGGEEFLLVLPDTGLEVATRIAERVRMQVSTHSLELPSGLHLPITVSIGVSSTEIEPTNLMLLDTLFQRADTALYRAKQNGRNQVMPYTKESNLQVRQANAG